MRDVPEHALGHEGEERLADRVSRDADELRDRRLAERRARWDLAAEAPITKRLGGLVDRAAAADLDARQEALVLNGGTVSGVSEVPQPGVVRVLHPRQPQEVR